jgi:uncharacterized membrane protein
MGAWTLTWAGSAALPLAAALFAAVAAALLWGSAAGPKSPARWASVFLKLLGAAAIAACLLEPLRSGRRARPGANVFCVLADNSQSMAVKDGGAARSRGDRLRERLDPARPGWQETLARAFDLRRFVFDARLQPSRDFSELVFDGRSTALGGALRSVADRFRGRPLAGLLLFTDGNATDLRGFAAAALDGVPPVYPVVSGAAGAFRDISLREVSASQTDFEDAPVTIQAVVESSGFKGRPVVVRVADIAGREVARQVRPAGADGEAVTVRFQIKPDRMGLCFYEVVAGLDEAGPAAANDEATLVNNRRVVVVDRGAGPRRILYVAGRPNWEFKFLNRAAQEDPQLDLVGLIRVARREPKFDFRGRAGETSNPLFRGSEHQDAGEVERYDQPVLVRLNTRDELELRNGFPRVPEDLYGFRAVIIADVESEFFSPDQAALLEKFASERGGGVLMLGGMESFREGGYQRTPIGEMLPVYLDASEASGAGPVQFTLTREGMLQGWARLRDTEAAERDRLAGTVPFRVFNRVRDIKPGASVIAKAADEKGREFPALVIQRFGRGRTAALLAGDWWRWGFQDAARHADLDKAWRQLLRWLSADTPDPVQVTAVSNPEDPNGGVRLEVRVRDAKFQPVDNAAVTLEVEPVLYGTGGIAPTNRVRLQAEPSAREAGLYEAAYVPRLSGGYHAVAWATNSAGASAGRAEAGWSSDLAAEEFRSLSPNLGLLEEIARKTGGALVSDDKLDAFARDLPERSAPVMEPWSPPLWHTPAMFLFAVLCIVGEWGLRRWKGLP